MIIVILIIVFIIFIFIARKFYSIKYDTVIGFSGGLGSGKSYESVKLSVKLLNRNRKAVRRHNFWTKFFNLKRDILETPMLYSSIPVRISRKEWSIPLTANHLLLVDKQVPRSITFIDEIGSFLNQHEYKHVNADSFDEFIRFYRHYHLGGYLVCNDQASGNIVNFARRRMNHIYNLFDFKPFLHFFYSYKVRLINISDDIKSVETETSDEQYKVVYGVFSLFRRYDTYCYSERYKQLEYNPNDLPYKSYKKNKLLKMPSLRINKKIQD